MPEDKEEGEEVQSENEKQNQKIALLSNKIKAICSAIEEVLDIFKNNPIYESGDTAIKRYPKFLTVQQLLDI